VANSSHVSVGRIYYTERPLSEVHTTPVEVRYTTYPGLTWPAASVGSSTCLMSSVPMINTCQLYIELSTLNNKNSPYQRLSSKTNFTAVIHSPTYIGLYYTFLKSKNLII